MFVFRSLPVVAGAVLVVLGSTARADDVTTLSGQTFRDARVARVEPDGVTWAHATGVVKVDFSDLPEAVRKEFHYDAARAAAFTAAQARAQQEVAARTQQTQREAEARRVRQVQAAAASVETESRPGEFVIRRHDHAAERFERSLGEQIAGRKAAEARAKEFNGTIYDPRLWAIPCMLLGHSDGHLFDARPTPPDFGGGGDYQAKSWNERLDVEDAMARDRR